MTRATFVASALVDVPLHGVGVGEGQRQCSAHAARRADGALRDPTQSDQRLPGHVGRKGRGGCANDNRHRAAQRRNINPFDVILATLARTVKTRRAQGVGNYQHLNPLYPHITRSCRPAARSIHMYAQDRRTSIAKDAILERPQ